MNENWQVRYARLVEFLGKALGPDHEIVLHDLSDNEHSVIAIANSHVSGRKLNAPLSSLALRFINSKEYEGHDSVLNYEGVSVNGERLRCSTMFIRDERGELAGMLCINFSQQKVNEFAADVMDFMREHLGAELPGSERVGLDLVENFSESVAQTFNSILVEMFGECDPARHLTQDQKIEILTRMEESGVFRVKGAITEVAELIHSSIASVYRYLAVIRKKKG